MVWDAGHQNRKNLAVSGALFNIILARFLFNNIKIHQRKKIIN